MKQYIEKVPVSEGLPTENIIYDTNIGEVLYDPRVKAWSGHANVEWWLRPLSLAVPESVSELVNMCRLERSGGGPEFYYVYSDSQCEEAISALLASRDEEVKELKTQAGLDAIHAEGLQTRLTACESALEKRDEELKRLREAAEQLLRFMDPNGKPYDGFAFRDAAVQLRALLTTNTTPTNE